jgi:hypothetical protein
MILIHSLRQAQGWLRRTRKGLWLKKPVQLQIAVSETSTLTLTLNLLPPNPPTGGANSSTI